MQDSLLKRYARDPAALSEQINGDFPRVISIVEDAGEVTLQLEVTPELAWFQGHFPGEPVLAGIIQAHWAAEVASALFGFDAPPQQIKRLKFSSIIAPPRTIDLELARHGDSEVQFRIRSAGTQHSQGRLVFPEPAR